MLLVLALSGRKLYKCTANVTILFESDNYYFQIKVGVSKQQKSLLPKRLCFAFMSCKNSVYFRRCKVTNQFCATLIFVTAIGS